MASRMGWFLVLIGLLAPAAWARPPDEPAAVVLRVTGKPCVHEPGTKRKGTLLSPLSRLYPGQLLVLYEGDIAVLALVDQGRRVTLQGPLELPVTAEGVKGGRQELSSAWESFLVPGLQDLSGLAGPTCRCLMPKIYSDQVRPRLDLSLLRRPRDWQAGQEVSVEVRGWDHERWVRPSEPARVLEGNQLELLFDIGPGTGCEIRFGAMSAQPGGTDILRGATSGDWRPDCKVYVYSEAMLADLRRAQALGASQRKGVYSTTERQLLVIARLQELKLYDQACAELEALPEEVRGQALEHMRQERRECCGLIPP